MIWRQSIGLVRGLAPKRILLTHFGSWEDPERHLDQLEDRLRLWSDVAHDVMASGGDVTAVAEKLTELDDASMEAVAVPEEIRRSYRSINPMIEAAHGLCRYHRKKLNVER